MRFIFLVLAICFSAGKIAAQHQKTHNDENDNHSQRWDINKKEPLRTQVGHRVIYHLYISDTLLNYDSSKKKHKGMAINGHIPGPELHFTEGDTAWIYVHNGLKEDNVIHWHGLIIPNEEDGVSYLTTAPTPAGKTHLYKFPIIQNGTYWYHSHQMLQEQSGLYGAFIIDKKIPDTLPNYTLVLSDWTNDNPMQVNRFLHNANDWYAVRKGSVQSYGEALRQKHLGTKITNEWKRQLAMDVSDVYYDALTSNGKLSDSVPNLHAGQKIRLHIVNGAASTYFWLTYAGGKMTVVATDGKDVHPVSVDKMIIGAAETYDIIVSIPQNMAYELRATAEDRTKYTSLMLGKGMLMTAPALGRLDYFAGMKMMNGMMHMDGSMDDMGMEMSLQQMDMNAVMYPENKKTEKMTMPMSDMSADEMDGMDMSAMTPTESNNKTVVLNYNMLKSPTQTTLPAGKWHYLHFELTGNMRRYLWSINNKTVSESDVIKIKKGENYRIVVTNKSMMRHPMHLHGHFFRLVNKYGVYSPWKNTFDIMPMETDTIEFHGDQYGDWFFHCHILYHMMSGMGRIFSYENSPVNQQYPDRKMAYKMIAMDDKKYYPKAEIGLESNGSDGSIQYANIRNQFSTEWRVGLNRENGYEWETHFGRYVDKMQFLMPYVGFDLRYRSLLETEKNLFGQQNTKNDRKAFCAGIQYALPLWIMADARIATDGKFRVQFSKSDMAVTSRLRLNAMWNTDREWMTGLRYVVGKYWSLSSHYDSDMGFGAGVTLNY